jgi:hypothetical protein
MTEKKTDVLNLRVDPALSTEIDRIAAWRGKTASEVARDLLQYGVRVERDLEAQELRRAYDRGSVDRNAENVRVVINAELKFLSYRELADALSEDEEERAAAEDFDSRKPW